MHQRQHEVAQRGATIMPFDLSRTTHVFDDEADGGLQTVTANDPSETAQIYLIRDHLADLANRMARIDVLAFGGGFASVPLMFHEIVEVRSWMDGPTFLNGILLGQVTPGPIVITATFIGYWLHGFLGAVVATFSVFFPSFLIVVGMTPYFDRLRASPFFNKALGGILSSFVGLLLTVTVRFAEDVSWDFSRLFLASAAFVALLLQIDLLWVVLTGAVVSLMLF